MAGTPLRRVHAKWHEVNIVVTQNKIVHKSSNFDSFRIYNQSAQVLSQMVQYFLKPFYFSIETSKVLVLSTRYSFEHKSKETHEVAMF